MAWGKNGTPQTLSTTSDTNTISDLSGSKCNQIMAHYINSSYIREQYRFGGSSIDTGSNYAERYSNNGGADGTVTSDTHINNTVDASYPAFDIGYIVAISSKEKLMIFFQCSQGATGSSYYPSRREMVGKWANTSDTLDQIQQYNDHSGDYTTGTNLSALGSDLTPASATTIETGSIYIDTDTNQRYFWNGSSWSLQA